MLSSVGRLTAKVADLAEAEGRLLREHLIILSISFGLFLLGLLLLLIGLLLLLVATYLALALIMPPPAAVAICGAVLSVVALLFFWNAGRQVRR